MIEFINIILSENQAKNVHILCVLFPSLSSPQILSIIYHRPIYLSIPIIHLSSIYLANLSILDFQMTIS